MDVLTAAERSACMAAVKSANTTPELRVRRLIHAHGYRYRLHQKDLPGRPDLVFSGRRRVIFVHGCFWHGHSCPRAVRVPKTNRQYWIDKIERNCRRDATVRKRLRAAGWRILVLWECEIRNGTSLEKRIRRFLEKA
jgi:DNA mismatch endonuclease (patch repair protein)